MTQDTYATNHSFFAFLRKHRALTVIAYVVTVFLVIFIMASRSASAGLSTGSHFPAHVRQALTQMCNDTGFTVAQATWISVRGDSLSTTKRISFAGEVLNLQYNVGVYRCKSSTPTGIHATVFRAKSGYYDIPGASGNIRRYINGIANAEIAVGTPPSSGNVRYSFEAIPFSINTTGLVRTANITVSMSSKQFNWFTNGNVLGCVMPNPNTSRVINSGETIEVCPLTTAQATFRIELYGPAQGDYDFAGDCSSFRGWAIDQDDISQHLNAAIIITHRETGQQTVLGPVLADQPIHAEFNPAALAGIGIVNRGFDIPLPSSYKNGQTYDFLVWVDDLYNNGPLPITQIGSGSFNCSSPPEPPTISCDRVTLSPSRPEPGQSVTAQVIIDYSGEGAGSQHVIIKATAPGFTNHQVYNETLDYSYSGSITASLEVPGSLVVAGPFNVSFSIEAPGASPGSLTCNQGTNVANQPYFKVYGGDVQAGAAILETDGTCTKEPSARIIGWHNQAGANPGAGAGTQLAAFALGQIEGFASGQQRTPGEPKSLTFANTEANVYGGNWGAGNAPCAADFWSDEAPSIPGGGSAAIATGNPLTLQAGDSRTIYVDGDVRIDNDILYSFSSGDIQSPSDYPSFRLVAKGNIYVRRNVTELNGLFVAGGTFYTCSTNGSSPPNQGQLGAGHCDTPLTIHGAVIADTIKLNRTHGTLSDASTGERWDNALGKPAEKFIYSPLIWLTSDSSAGGSFDALRTLPPVL